MTAEPWVAVEDHTRHLRVSHDTVDCGIEAKGLPAHKLDRLWKFNLSELDDRVRAGGDAPDLSNGDSTKQ